MKTTSQVRQLTVSVPGFIRLTRFVGQTFCALDTAMCSVQAEFLSLRFPLVKFLLMTLFAERRTRLADSAEVHQTDDKCTSHSHPYRMF